MKSIFKLAFAALLLVGMTAQSSAQCAHTATNIAGIPATQGAGVGFGQSFLADCINDEFTDITFSLKNFNNAVWTVELFDGQSDDPADLLYSQSGVVPTMGAANPNSNGGVFYTATLGGGTGSLAYTQGQTYTFICTLESGSHAVEFGFGDQYAQGAQYYSNTSFTSVDNHFEFGSGASSGGAGECDHLSNGDFENGFDGWTGGITPNATDNFGLFVDGTGNPGGAMQLNAGSSSVVYANNTLTTEPGVEYTVSGEYKGGQLHYICPTGGVALQVVADGVILDSYSYDPTAAPEFAPFSTTFTATATTTVLTLKGQAQGDCSVVVDNMEVCGAADPVPTMGEWALITFGLIIMSMGVITVRRREQDLIVKAA
jgi:hypothetical protein